MVHLTVDSLTVGSGSQRRMYVGLAAQNVHIYGIYTRKSCTFVSGLSRSFGSCKSHACYCHTPSLTLLCCPAQGWRVVRVQQVQSTCTATASPSAANLCCLPNVPLVCATSLLRACCTARSRRLAEHDARVVAPEAERVGQRDIHLPSGAKARSQRSAAELGAHCARRQLGGK